MNFVLNRFPPLDFAAVVPAVGAIDGLFSGGHLMRKRRRRGCGEDLAAEAAHEADTWLGDGGVVELAAETGVWTGPERRDVSCVG